MELNKYILIKYANLKEAVENQAEKALKEYYKFKKWKFPTDFSLENVEIGKEEVYINYYGFQDYNTECLTMDYFLTLDNKKLNNIKS